MLQERCGYDGFVAISPGAHIKRVEFILSVGVAVQNAPKIIVVIPALQKQPVRRNGSPIGDFIPKRHPGIFCQSHAFALSVRAIGCQPGAGHVALGHPLKGCDIRQRQGVRGGRDIYLGVIFSGLYNHLVVLVRLQHVVARSGAPATFLKARHHIQPHFVNRDRSVRMGRLVGKALCAGEVAERHHQGKGIVRVHRDVAVLDTIDDAQAGDVVACRVQGRDAAAHDLDRAIRDNGGIGLAAAATVAGLFGRRGRFVNRRVHIGRIVRRWVFCRWVLCGRVFGWRIVRRWVFGWRVLCGRLLVTRAAVGTAVVRWCYVVCRG